MATPFLLNASDWIIKALVPLMIDKSTCFPHSTTKTLCFGAAPSEATHAVILLHGRGSGPQSIATQFLPTLLRSTTDAKICVLAPAAEDKTWYPNVYSPNLSENEPWLSGAVERIEREVQALEYAGVSRDKIMIGGFSQGACLAATYVMTYPAKYWGVFVLSGALLGLGSYDNVKLKKLERFKGVDLKGSRILVGCGDSDPFIKAVAAEWTGDAFSHTGASVDTRIYKQMPHTLCADELDVLKRWVDEISKK